MPQIDLNAYPIKEALPLLIRDKTTKENIIFAEEEYAHLGEGYSCKDQITLEKLKNPAFALRRRVDKNAAQQQDRTKVNAEVMTPAWVINKMVSHADEEWFGLEAILLVDMSLGMTLFYSRSLQFLLPILGQSFSHIRRWHCQCRH